MQGILEFVVAVVSYLYLQHHQPVKERFRCVQAVSRFFCDACLVDVFRDSWDR